MEHHTSGPRRCSKNAAACGSGGDKSFGPVLGRRGKDEDYKERRISKYWGPRRSTYLAVGPTIVQVVHRGMHGLIDICGKGILLFTTSWILVVCFGNDESKANTRERRFWNYCRGDGQYWSGLVLIEW